MLIVTVGLSTGCATNPATGKRQLAMMSEAQEIQIGKENDAAIVAQYGLYPDEELQAYIQELGTSMAAVSERPHLPWTFRVLDDPIVNAFALPGGYIYITRGIMAHLNSEAELAAVVGHEIGHVTGRHTVNRMAKASLMQLGLGVGMVLSPEFAQFGDLANTGLGLLFLKYSRDDERQADELGFRYSVREKFDPREAANVFRTLQAVGNAAGGQSLPSFMATHPDPGNRALAAEQRAASEGVSYADHRIERESYFDRLDGMVFGADPRQGYFEESLFLHPEMAFQLRYPTGWTTSNRRDSVVGVDDPENATAYMELRLAEGTDLRATVKTFLTENELLGERIQTGKIHGLDAAWTTFETPEPTAEDAAAGKPHYAGRVTMIRHRDATFRLMALTTAAKYRTFERTFKDSLSSFKEVRDKKVLDVQPARLGVVRVDGELSLAEFGERYPSSVPIETLALINQVAPNEELPGGGLAKRITGGKSN